jgi:S-adenosylmethionine synthetase
VAECPSIVSAQCCLVSQIGQLITQPGIIDIALSTIDDIDENSQIEPVHDITASVLNSLPTKYHQFINGDIRLY